MNFKALSLTSYKDGLHVSIQHSWPTKRKDSPVSLKWSQSRDKGRIGSALGRIPPPRWPCSRRPNKKTQLWHLLHSKNQPWSSSNIQVLVTLDSTPSLPSNKMPRDLFLLLSGWQDVKGRGGIKKMGIVQDLFGWTVPSRLWVKHLVPILAQGQSLCNSGATWIQPR